MRLFAAVDPPRMQVEGLDAAIGARDPQLRWVPMEQWHVTLAFYGDVPESRLDELQDRLARAAARTSAFTLRLAGAGTFPSNAGRARQLWVGLDGETDVLGRLAASCAAAGRRIGLRMEERAYRPHLTLARARRETTDASDRLAGLQSYAGEPWRVTELRLVHSTLGRQVVHRPLLALPFRG